jgi:ATP-binding cassette subfamily B multidrug efflux pump
VEEEVLGKAYDSRLMRRLLGYMRPYRGYVALSLVFLLLQSVLQVLGPLLTKIAVDRYLAPSPTRIPTPIDRYLPVAPGTAWRRWACCTWAFCWALSFSNSRKST